jgi:Protein of unknown function (DUF3489)
MPRIKTVKSHETEKPRDTAARPRDSNGKRKRALLKRVPHKKATKPARRSRDGSKLELCLALLRRAEGASVEELQKRTGWQAHSVRGFLAGAVKRKLGLALVSEKAAAQPRRYRIPQVTA